MPKVISKLGDMQLHFPGRKMDPGTDRFWIVPIRSWQVLVCIGEVAKILSVAPFVNARPSVSLFQAGDNPKLPHSLILKISSAI
jgi:hypothetical protein